MAVGESVVDLDDASLRDDRDDVDSLPSLSTTDVYSDSDAEAQAEWERSLEQLQLILTMMIVPWVGWARYMEWMHNVEIRWTSKKTFKVAGAVEAAATLYTRDKVLSRAQDGAGATVIEQG